MNQLVLEHEFSRQIREQAMRWLDQRRTDVVDYNWLTTFEYDGQRIPLMDRQRGIRKPAILDAALSIRTVFTEPGATPPYEDQEGPDGLIRYKYRGDDPLHPENRALRRAYLNQLPLIWFVGVAPGLYLPRYPVWIVSDEPRDLQFGIAVDQGQRLIKPGEDLSQDTKQYVERLNRVRLHQPLFRSRVLAAYRSRCAVCRLGHADLLDAAHIIGDSKPHGEPVVPNGLALCKIHHAAFDRYIMGVRPDLTVAIRSDVLEEVDGPMLRHGLQEMNNQRLTTPTGPQTRPDVNRLEERYAEFLTYRP